MGISNSKSSVLAVEKAKDHVMFTGTALIPGEPDCDASNGEEILTAEKVAKIAHEFMNYRIIDKEHEFLVTKKNVGDPVESYLLDAPKVMKNIKGEEREYPAGTWVVKSKITDPEMMEAALKGEIAYSVSVLSKEDADEVMSSLKSRVLIKDINNPVAFTLTLTKNPCVDNSCSTKSNPNFVGKEGRVISKQSKNKIQEAINLLTNFINPKSETGGDNVTKEKENETKEYVEKSDIEEIVDKAVDKAMKAQKESSSGGGPTKCSNCGAVVKVDDKYCSNCGTKLTSSSKKSKEEEKETPGSKGASKSLKPNGEEKLTPAVKSFEEELGRDLYGCKM